MNDEEMKNLLYSIYDFPPKTRMREDRDFVWALVKAGCPIKYILEATEQVFVHDFPDDAYEDWEKDDEFKYDES